MKLRLLAAAFAAAFAVSPAFAQTKTLRAVMHSDLKVLDPIWITANIVRNHGYMVWDTLEGGWNGFMTAWLSIDMMNPLTNSILTASCDKANFGWPCDAEVERPRDAYARAPDLPSSQKIAAELRARAVQYGTHIHLGQYTLPTATRADRLSGMVKSPIPVFWNIEKK